MILGIFVSSSLQRMLIGLAGPTSNFILAFVAMIFYYAGSMKFRHQECNLEWVTPAPLRTRPACSPVTYLGNSAVRKTQTLKLSSI